jgi:plasmid stabilization system protein ParE
VKGLLSVTISEDAESDLVAIARYIRRLDGSKAAAIFVGELVSRCGKLATTGASLRLRPEFGESVRASHHKGYLIIFEITNATVNVLRVASTARDLSKLSVKSRP